MKRFPEPFTLAHHQILITKRAKVKPVTKKGKPKEKKRKEKKRKEKTKKQKGSARCQVPTSFSGQLCTPTPNHHLT